MILGVDPGKQGALALFEGDVPIATHQFKPEKGKRFFDMVEVEQFEAFIPDTVDTVIMEALLDHRQLNQSPVHTNTTAVNWGVWWGLCIKRGIVPITYRGRDWKRALHLGKDKQLSLDMARELYPTMADNLKLKKNNDVAEALLLVYYHNTVRTA